MADMESLPPLRDVIARYELRTRKTLGQHFLCDLNLTRRIAELAGNLSGCTVFEIGPGPGGLTRALVESDAAHVIAIEKDARCVAALADVVDAAQGKLRVIAGDALKIDLLTLKPDTPSPAKTKDLPSSKSGFLLPPPPGGRESYSSRAIVANLPYNIGTELLLGWLKDIQHYRSLTLMFQSEVVDRLCAAPGSKIYGRLSVIAQFCCNVKRVLDVPAEAFTPPPKIDSAVAHLTPRRDRPSDVTFEMIEKVTAAAFGQRRKMLRSSLKPLGGENLLRRAGIDPERRAETLSLAEFEGLARLALQNT